VNRVKDNEVDDKIKNDFDKSLKEHNILKDDHNKLLREKPEGKKDDNYNKKLNDEYLMNDYKKLVEENNDLKKEIENKMSDKGRTFTFGSKNKSPEEKVDKNLEEDYNKLKDDYNRLENDNNKLRDNFNKLLDESERIRINI
jgi:hypothetical protein